MALESSLPHVVRGPAGVHPLGPPGPLGQQPSHAHGSALREREADASDLHLPRGHPSLAGHLRPLPSSCNRVKSYFADGKTTARSPGGQRAQLSPHGTLLEEARTATGSDCLRPGDRQSNFGHPTAKGFARAPFLAKSCCSVSTVKLETRHTPEKSIFR